MIIIGNGYDDTHEVGFETLEHLIRAVDDDILNNSHNDSLGKIVKSTIHIINRNINSSTYISLNLEKYPTQRSNKRVRDSVYDDVKHISNFEKFSKLNLIRSSTPIETRRYLYLKWQMLKNKD